MNNNNMIFHVVLHLNKYFLKAKDICKHKYGSIIISAAMKPSD